MYELQKDNIKVANSINNFSLQLPVHRIDTSHVCAHAPKFPQENNLTRYIRGH